MGALLGPQAVPLIVALGAALIVLVLGIGLAGGDGTSTRTVEKRLKRSGADGYVPERDKGGRGVRRDEPTTGFAVFLRRVLPNPDKLRARLERTGKEISITGFFFICVATGIIATLAFKVAAHMGLGVAAMSGLLVALIVPNKIIGIMGNRRNKKFMKDFPGAIDMIVRGLKAGLPFIESVNAVGKEFPDPVGIEFRRVSDAVKLGQTVEQALWEVARRIDMPEFKFMIVALTIQSETGGNLAETLGNLSDLLRKRRALYLKIRALSSEARASAYIIGALPFVMFFLLKIVNPDYVEKLWTTDRGTRWSIVGLCIMFTGFYVMYRMVNFEV